MAIINLRGTSGSGKSTVVRQVMALYNMKVPEFINNRRQPIGYQLHNSAAADSQPLWVLGHYEGDCGGGDTISAGYEYIYALLREKINAGNHVIFEGLVLQNEMARCVQLSRDYPGQLTVFLLNTPLNVCIESVITRRTEKATRTGKEAKPFNPKNTEGSYKSTHNQRPRFRDAGVDFRYLSREDTLRDITQLLSL